MTVPTTLPRLLARNAATMGSRPAMREKRHGIWQTTSWSDYAALVSRFAAGLAARGFRRGDKLAVIGNNRPRLYASLLAAQSLGGTGVPIWPDAEPEWIAGVLQHASVSAIVVEDHDQVGKLLAVRDRLPALSLLVHLETHSMQQDGTEWLQSFDAMLGQGTSVDTVKAEPGDLALLLYSADATGAPHGVMLSHANLLAAATSLSSMEDVRRTDETLAWLPMAWFGDVLTSQALAVATGYTCNCPEGPETARRDLREIGPTILLAPPHIWGGTLAEIETKVAQASPLKRVLFSHFRRSAEERQRTSMLGELLICAPVRDQVGMRRMRWALSVGEPLAPHVLQFFRAFGVNLKQCYGIPELSGVAIVQNSVCTGLNVSVANDEVLVRGASVCLGYHRDLERTRLATTEDGRWRTGDAGRLDAGGHLTILDRAAHVVRLDDGTMFVPRLVESNLQRSPFIRDAIAFCYQNGAAAMISIDQVRVGAWTEGQNLVHTSLADLIALPEVRGLIRTEIRRLGVDLAPGTRVRRFLLLDRPLAGEDSATVLSRDLRRGVAERLHAALIAVLLGNDIAATEVQSGEATPRRLTGVFIEEIGDAPGSWAAANA